MVKICISNRFCKKGYTPFKGKFFIFCLLSPVFLGATETPDPPADTPTLADEWNKKLKEDGTPGEFKMTSDGKAVVFEGANVPAWAKQNALETLGFDMEGRYGSGGINPLLTYKKEDFFNSKVFKFCSSRGYGADHFNNVPDEGPGSDFLAIVYEKMGGTVLKDMHDEREEEARSDRFWKRFFTNIFPNLITNLRQPKTFRLFFTSVLVLFGIPIILWHLSKAVIGAMFARRPEILGKDDTDIPKNFIKRLFWKPKPAPQVIANDELKSKINALVAANKEVSDFNKKHGNIFGGGKKMSYSHVLAYGPPGTGKTLFAKQLARKSNIHFIYITVGDLAQLDEEKALETLKKYFKYARRKGPCIFIVDEAEVLFKGGDAKTKKLSILFLREFSKALDTKVQLFLITNHPYDIPAAVKNRCFHKIYFDKPAFETQKSLFETHLKRAFAAKDMPIPSANSYTAQLTKELCEGLVGRDIEAICVSFSMSKNHSARNLARIIQRYKRDREVMEGFDGEDSHVGEETPISLPQKETPMALAPKESQRDKNNPGEAKAAPKKEEPEKAKPSPKQKIKLF